MLGLSTIEAVYVVLVFIVPGYVFLTLRNQFVAGQDRLGTDQILAFITYSAVNFALFGWVIFLAISNQAGPYISIAIWIATLIIIPAALGLMSGLCSQKEIARRVYGLLQLNPIDPTPRAWDRIFFNSPPAWVLVTLKNGTQFAGFWGGQSFASSDAKERDLYISEVFEFNDSEPWRPTGKGVFIAAGEIRTIEFTPVKQETDNERRN